MAKRAKHFFSRGEEEVEKEEIVEEEAVREEHPTTPTKDKDREVKLVKEEEEVVLTPFVVLRGVHSEGGKMYEAGQIVMSKSDLLKHNHVGAEKFGLPVSAAPDKKTKKKSTDSDDD